jgi:CheY-like chemotaxis protein
MLNNAKNCYHSPDRNRLVLEGLKVLIVDDDQDTLYLANFILQAYGVQVITAVSALDALEVMEKFQPQVLVSDIAMPQIDGFSLISKIRQGKFLDSDIPAIAITALLDTEKVLESALQAGFQACLTKPFDGDELIDSIVSLHLG